MEFLIFIGSYFLLSGVLGMIFILITAIGIVVSQRKAYLEKKSNEEWNQSLTDKGGRKTYLILSYSYFIAAMVMLPLSQLWFNWIGFKHSKLAIFMIGLIILANLVIKLPKLKGMVEEKIMRYKTHS